jgi:hypothetical protein
VFRGFADFFPLHTEEFGKRVNIISMEEFVKREGGADGHAPIPPATRDDVINSADHCDKREQSKTSLFACSIVSTILTPSARRQVILWTYRGLSSRGRLCPGRSCTRLLRRIRQRCLRGERCFRGKRKVH